MLLLVLVWKAYSTAFPCTEFKREAENSICMLKLTMNCMSLPFFPVIDLCLLCFIVILRVEWKLTVVSKEIRVCKSKFFYICTCTLYF